MKQNTQSNNTSINFQNIFNLSGINVENRDINDMQYTVYPAIFILSLFLFFYIFLLSNHIIDLFTS